MIRTSRSVKELKLIRQARRQKWPNFYTLTSALRPLPNALIIGAQKSGTTSLNGWLRYHPSVQWSSLKEVHFFDRNYEKGRLWYQSHFPLRQRFCLLGRPSCVIEASPAYLYEPSVPGRIKELLPKARLILLLRNPVNRAISHYKHTYRNGRETRSMSEALLSNEGRDRWGMPCDINHYLAQGQYAEQLERYMNLFDPAQMLILKSEEMFQAPDSVFAKVLKFLGLIDLPLACRDALNVGSRKNRSLPASSLAVSSDVDRRLRLHYEPWNERLKRLVPDFDIWSD